MTKTLFIFSNSIIKRLKSNKAKILGTTRTHFNDAATNVTSSQYCAPCNNSERLLEFNVPASHRITLRGANGEQPIKTWKPIMS